MFVDTTNIFSVKKLSVSEKKVEEVGIKSFLVQKEVTKGRLIKLFCVKHWIISSPFWVFILLNVR